MNDILSRILSALESQGKNPTDMCKEIGVANSTFFTWKTKDKIPPTEAIQKIARYLNVSVDYLVNGTESYYLDPEVQEIAEEMATRSELKVLFKASRNVSKEQIEAINNMIKAMTD